MTDANETVAADVPGPRRGSLRLRITLVVLITVVVGLTAGIVADYHRERRVHITELFESLEDQAHTLSLARDSFKDRQAFIAFTGQYCKLSTHEDLSPGHHVVVLDPAGAVVAAVGHADVLGQPLRPDAPARELFTLDGREIARVHRRETDGTVISVAQYIDHVHDILRAQLLSRTLTGAAVAVALVVLLFLFLNRWVLKPVAELASAAKTWAARNFAARAPADAPAEVGFLGREFNVMASRLEVVEENREREMDRARRIQQNLLPQPLPRVRSLHVAATYRPAERVAGDLYDVFEIENGRTALAVIDVAGHGVSAALLTGVVKMSLHRRLAETDDLGEAMTRVNRDLLDCATEGEFVAASVGVWNPDERTWEVCVAGQYAGMLIRGGAVCELDGAGPLLGILHDASWPVETGHLKDGDRVILYTDGVIEAGAPGEQLGTAGVKTLLRNSIPMDLDGQVAYIGDQSSTRCASAACDDITILAFEVLPSDHPGSHYVI